MDTERQLADVRTKAEDLYRQLLAPVAAAVAPGTKKLILVPHGILHYLPFAALRDPDTGSYLVERYVLTYSPSASVLGLLRAKESPVEGTALVAAVPRPPDEKLGTLEHADQEATAVARLFGVAPLLGTDATEGAIRDRAGSVDLVHLVAHGLYDPSNPRFSRIALLPSDGQDGNLEVHEVYGGLDLTGVNLVVLSACQTALGERSGGDDIVGLTRAFLYAGSPGVISTLWNIDDLATTDLMIAFYQELAHGMTAAEALRDAQLHLLADGRHEDPYYWAAFTLTGDPQVRWRTSPAAAE